MEIVMTDAERIEQIRTAQNLSVSGLARKANLSRRTLYNIQEGEPVSLETAVKLAQALEVPLSDISPEAAATIAAVA